MSWFRKNPWFALALAGCAVLVVAEGWLIFDRYSTARALARKWQEKRAQLDDMTVKVPPPTRAVATAIEADLKRAQRSLEAMQAELKGRGPAAERLHAAKVPTSRTDAYFDLANFVEKTRELARKYDVDVRPEAGRFGFAAHANEAPQPDRIEPVFRQRQLVQYLVEALIEARPRTLLSVKRERPLTKKEREDRDAAAAAAAAAIASGATPEPVPEASNADDGPDFFVLDPRVSVRSPGFIDSSAFRVAFVGETGSLRALLNRLAGFELPALVREVEVELASSEEVALTASPTESAGADAPAAATPSVVLRVGPVAASEKKAAPKAVNVAAPIVAKPFSRFTVTVEFVELVTAASTGGDAAQPSSSK